MLVGAAGRFFGSPGAVAVAAADELEVGRSAAAAAADAGALDVEGCGWCENGQRNTLQVLQSGHSPNSFEDGNMALAARKSAAQRSVRVRAKFTAESPRIRPAGRLEPLSPTAR